MALALLKPKTTVRSDLWGTGLETWVDDFFKDFLPVSQHEENFHPKIDFRETKDSFQILAELPGVEQENIDISLEKNVLTIKGEKKFEKKTEEKDRWYTERRFGSFTRAVSIPDDVNDNDIQAKFTNGVLEITLPKAETAKSKVKKISVQ